MRPPYFYQFSRLKKKKVLEIDPLYAIFKRHLNQFQDADLDRKTFIQNILEEYLGYLGKMKNTIPLPFKEALCEELFNQINLMLVKKIYGFYSIQEYQNRK